MIKKMMTPVLPIAFTALLAVLPTTVVWAADDSGTSGNTLVLADNDFTALQDQNFAWEATRFESSAYTDIKNMQIDFLAQLASTTGLGKIDGADSSTVTMPSAPSSTGTEADQVAPAAQYPIANEQAATEQSGLNTAVDYKSIY